MSKQRDGAGQSRAAHRVRPVDADGFSTFRTGRLQHDFHQHPLLQLPELAKLAQDLMPGGQCRFVHPGMAQDSAFHHVDRHPDGRDIEQVFERIEEPGSWIALYNIEKIPRYRALLDEILETVRPVIEREQTGIFNITGFCFISAPPSVTPFHIDRENNFWLQLHGRKALTVWDASDRGAVPAEAVEDFIVNHSSRKVRMTEAGRNSGHEFDSGPGDGVYFPTTSPHMTRSDDGWATPGDGVSVSLGVTFYTSHTKKLARVHQYNRALRKYLHWPSVSPGQSPRLNAIKAPIGWLLGVTRHVLLRQLHAIRALRSGTRPADGWWGEKAPPGSF